MYLFHRGQHVTLSYLNAEFFLVLLFPLVDRLASFYRLILDTLVCWCCVCVFILFHLLASSDCKTSVTYLRSLGQRSFLASIARGFCQIPSSLFPNLSYLTSKDVTPARQKTGEKTISYTGILQKDIYWYRLSDGHVPSREVTKRYER